MEIARDVVVIFAIAMALALAVKGVAEYARANALRRAGRFHQMRVRFDTDPGIQAVCRLLHGTGAEHVSQQQKEVFISFFEEVHFMVRSGIMKRDLALYAFGSHAREASRNDRFWSGLDKGSPFYDHFRRFADEAQSYVPDASPQPSAFRF
jgi:hypothetical protein